MPCSTTPTSSPPTALVPLHPRAPSSLRASKSRTDDIHRSHQREQHAPRERDENLRAWVGVRFGRVSGSAGEGITSETVSEGLGGVKEENGYCYKGSPDPFWD
ncbi:hypothetical protein D9619_004184 [Psilocybe cf. subviscida]|uniref:Uncharacterized protein n=1 Tax=Psilocybe cf. subviscida TaxID=2480587 RepID=A0A8H5F7R5_9AGAR|nr:hypothetical protein D9619_004184 [Psilocybe cf. subviscida]